MSSVHPPVIPDRFKHTVGQITPDTINRLSEKLSNPTIDDDMDIQTIAGLRIFPARSNSADYHNTQKDRPYSTINNNKNDNHMNEPSPYMQYQTTSRNTMGSMTDSFNRTETPDSTSNEQYDMVGEIPTHFRKTQDPKSKFQSLPPLDLHELDITKPEGRVHVSDMSSHLENCDISIIPHPQPRTYQHY